ncbi:MAG: 30S ribosomal protein S16 [Acidimicrobiia bacterium]|nr:30S ribosomal protein S16 [Acidimicrobiia bacterium]
MATKIRLTRLGKKKQPTYRVVVMDSRKPRDGKYIEQLGIYDPRQDPSIVTIDNERALYWLNTGAQPTERAQKLLEISGAWTQFRIAKGDIHTVSAASDDAAPSGDAVSDDAVAVVASSGEAPSSDGVAVSSETATAAFVEDVVAEEVVVEEAPVVEAAVEDVSVDDESSEA